MKLYLSILTLLVTCLAEQPVPYIPSEYPEVQNPGEFSYEQLSQCAKDCIQETAGNVPNVLMDPCKDSVMVHYYGCLRDNACPDMSEALPTETCRHSEMLQQLQNGYVPSSAVDLASSLAVLLGWLFLAL